MSCDNNLLEPTARMQELLRAVASPDPGVQQRACAGVSKAIMTPIRQGVMEGSIIGQIFTQVPMQPGQAPDFPYDPVPQGQERNFVAYTIPYTGKIPERKVEGDYVAVSCYRIGNSIDMDLKYIRDARWDVVARAAQVLEGGFVRKFNQDGFHVLLAAAYGRGLNQTDSQAPSGLFTKRLQSQMQITMRRYAGGNSASSVMGTMTHLFMSIESVEDVRAWDLTQIDDFTRREIFLSSNEIGGTPMTRVGGTLLVPLYEFGVGQEFQTYWTGTLGGSVAAGKAELVLGIDKNNDDSFVMPVRQPIEVFVDPTVHRWQKAGWYGWCEVGFACLNSTRTLAGSL